MLHQKDKCLECGQKYEILWYAQEKQVIDWDGSDYDPEDDDEIDDISDEVSEDPVYCPFCGTHRDYQ